MRNLYWKLFLFFWCAMICMMLSSAWITAQFARQSSISFHKNRLITDNATASAIIEQVGNQRALNKWLHYLKESHGTDVFLLRHPGKKIFSSIEGNVPASLRRLAKELERGNFADNSLYKFGPVVMSNTIYMAHNKSYRLILVHPPAIHMDVQEHWQNLILRLLLAILFSGLICYILARYLTKPLEVLQSAAKKIGKGTFNVRVLGKLGTRRDEFFNLAQEFDIMAAKLESSLAAQQRLLNDISHELRSPLARLQVTLELIRKRIDEKQVGFELDRMERECDRLNELIGDILTLAKLNSVTSTSLTKHTEVDLIALLQSVIDDVNFEMQSSGLKISLNTSITEYSFDCDEKTLRCAFENLIRNAVHHAQTNIDISVCYCEHHKSVKIEIRDYGQGVAENELTQLFKPFYRHPTTKSAGYGLGLAIAKKAIKLHHGSIKIANHPEGGLLVEVCLPKDDAA